ncbi:MAG: filamentous hemagglutinin N-terminal domain-containing protein, partial [Rhodoferax sp.]|nr:filamentous hemagglutinin N-terminal domain-containing protein [Rhodoferax sp.]
MNANTFRLIFSKRLGMCVPVAEQRSAQGKGAAENTADVGLKPLAFSLALLCAAPALALPGAPSVTNGSASFSQSGSTLTITNTPNAIINWGSFSIGQNELTKFIQQSSASAVLNRVTGQNPSQILGQLQSNGRVFLINPNGIVFGAGSRIDTAGLIASTLNLSDADFLGGKLRLTGTGSEGKVENQGTITTTTGGFVYLIAPNVENSGVIHAPNGDVLLAAGQSVEIADGLNPALRVVLTAPEGQVVNLGQILAESGRIGLHGGMVANSGTISASSAVAEGGKIYLRATEKIELTDTSVLRADGTAGGEITAIVQKDGQIAGDLVARGEISAQGYGTAGSGGFVETSATKVDLNGINVKTGGGEWLIDPYDFTIAASGGDITGSALATALGGNSVTIQTANGGINCTNATCGSGNASGNGDIFVNDAVSWNAATTLTLSAYRHININQSITASDASGKIALEYGQGAVAAGNTATYFVKAPVNLQAGNNFSTKLGSDGSVRNFTVITLLGNASSSNDGTLQGLQSNLSGNFVLGADINADATSTWNSDGANGYYGFSRIGNGQTFDNSSRFIGVFDGLGHTISNLYIRRPNATTPTFNANDYVGLFGVNQGLILNVGLLNANVSGRASVGALVGVNGVNAGAVVLNSYSTGSVNGADGVGGLIGQMNGGIVRYSYSSASVSSGGAVGGLVGVVNATSGGTVNNSYALGTVSGSTAGGLVGALNSVGTVTNSYSASPGVGLIGSGSGLVTNSYWDNVIGASSSAGTGAVGRTSAQMKDALNFTGWDFTNLWNIDVGATISYPYLRNNEQIPHPGLTTVGSSCS